jgi:hypothetical protein
MRFLFALACLALVFPAHAEDQKLPIPVCSTEDDLAKLVVGGVMGVRAQVACEMINTGRARIILTKPSGSDVGRSLRCASPALAGRLSRASRSRSTNQLRRSVC